MPLTMLKSFVVYAQIRGWVFYTFFLGVSDLVENIPQIMSDSCEKDYIFCESTVSNSRLPSYFASLIVGKSKCDAKASVMPHFLFYFT